MDKLNYHKQRLENLVDELAKLSGKIRWTHALVVSLQKDSERPSEEPVITFDYRKSESVNRKYNELNEARFYRALTSLYYRRL